MVATDSKAAISTSQDAGRLETLRRLWLRIGLPAKLLVLTAAFVLIAEILIFLPSIANYRVSWLKERLTAAQLAALASEAFPGGDVPSALRVELLRTAQVKAVASRRGGIRRLVLPVERDLIIHEHYDLRHNPQNFWERFTSSLDQISKAAGVLFSSNGRTIRVIGSVADDPDDLIEIVMPEAPLKAAMVQYSLNIISVSIIISLLTAAVVYFALSRLLVKPMMRISDNMVKFAESPEDEARIIVPSGRQDEIGVAETELAQMQRELSDVIAQKNRLAELGLAVSKINHDLRGMLANAQLISDRLVDIPDPTVQRFAPKLIASLDRAIDFCNASLQYGKVAEPAPHRAVFPLKTLVEEVVEALGGNPDGPIRFAIDMEDHLTIDADREQMFRILTNMLRNSMQAIEGTGEGTAGTVTIKARREHRKIVFDITDDGPGIPPKARENLFKAFQGSSRKGGTGLGLVIAQELVQAHGGDLRLMESDKGAHFQFDIPDRKVV